jgi:hypothetical protein
MDEAYLLASNSIRCGRAWRGGAECHRWRAPAIRELGLALPDRFAEIDLAGGGQGAGRRADTSTDRRTGERVTNQGTTNRADSATDPGPAQATVSGGIAACGKNKHASDHRQLQYNAFHSRSPYK